MNADSKAGITRKRARPALLFVRHFLADPRAVGSMIPSSRWLSRRLLAGIDWRTARIIVEYGPGTGVITRAILAQMHPEARLLAFEINDDFVEFLRRDIADPRLTVVAASAECVDRVLDEHGLAHCDAAISSLPFSIMPEPVRRRILAVTAKILAPGAAMVGYQYTTRWLRELQRSFGEVRVKFEPRNVPPAFVFTARRG